MLWQVNATGPAIRFSFKMTTEAGKMMRISLERLLVVIIDRLLTINYNLSPSLNPGLGERITAPIFSKKLHRRRGPVVTLSSSQVSLRAWSCAGHWKTRCSAVSSAPLQSGHVASNVV